MSYDSSLDLKVAICRAVGVDPNTTTYLRIELDVREPWPLVTIESRLMDGEKLSTATRGYELRPKGGDQ